MKTVNEKLVELASRVPNDYKIMCDFYANSAKGIDKLLFAGDADTSGQFITMLTSYFNAASGHCGFIPDVKNWREAAKEAQLLTEYNRVMAQAFLLSWE